VPTLLSAGRRIPIQTLGTYLRCVDSLTHQLARLLVEAQGLSQSDVELAGSTCRQPGADTFLSSFSSLPSGGVTCMNGRCTSRRKFANVNSVQSFTASERNLRTVNSVVVERVTLFAKYKANLNITGLCFEPFRHIKMTQFQSL